MSERDVFTAAREIADPAARSAYLDAACAGSPALRERVEALLRAHDRPDSLLDAPAVDPPPGDAAATRAYRTPEAEVADGETRTQGEVADEDTDDALAFLQPAGRPNSLGRIGHHEVLEVLGKGGFGIVFRAFDEVLQRVVAVKVLAPSMAATSPARKRFIREAQSAARIQHENVVRVHEVSRDDERLPYLVMEFISGETLQQRLDRKGPLEASEVVRVGRQIAEGLAAAHEKGLIHRDIKPSNILIDRGPQDHAKITDFGLARAADDASLTRSGVVAGTPMYMAPEQAKGEALDHRADLFSLGSVMYAMLTGRPPFRAETTLAVLKRVAEEDPRPIREVIPEVPEWLCRIVEKLHAKNPADRFQSAKEVAEVLADCEKQLEAHGALKDRSRIPAGKPAPSLSRARVPAWAVATCAAVIAFVAAAVWFPHKVDELVPWLVGALILGVITSLASARLPRPRDAVAESNPAVATRSGRWVWVAVAILALPALAAVVLTALPFPYLYATNKADLVFEGADPDVALLVVRRDGEVVARLARGSPRAVKLEPGEYEIEAECVGGYEATKFHVETTRLTSASGSFRRVEGRPVIRLTLRRGDTTSVVATAERRAAPSPAPDKDGWVQLFNGKDLTGWTTHPEETNAWKVAGGEIVGQGARSHLFTERGDFADFHFRAEVRVNTTGDSGVYFRAPFNLDGADRWPDAPEAQINNNPDGDPLKTGALHDNIARFHRLIVKKEEWFTLEVVARGPKVTVIVNGQVTAEADVAGAPRGRFALQVLPGTVVRFRKVEVKELPPTPAEQWTPLFNGKDLTGWKPIPTQPGDWKVEGDELVGRGPEVSHLVSERGGFENFHLRAEVKTNAPGNSGIFFHCSPQLSKGSNLPPGIECEIHHSLKWPTGSFNTVGGGGSRAAAAPPPPADSWVVLEIQVQGQQLTVQVSERPVIIDFPLGPYSGKGHLALQVYSPQTEVRFRKIEIKELAATANRVVIKYSKTGGGESSIRLDGQLVTRGELFQRLEALVAKNAGLKVFITGDIDPEAELEGNDFRQLLNTIAGAGVDVKNLEFEPGVRAKAEKVANGQRDVARNRIKRTSDLKEIGKSLQSYHDLNQSFPPGRPVPAKQFDNAGKPLLSWRVHLLPYLGEKELELYKKFHLDEPWDSPHNQKLLAENPDWFRTTADPEKTTYLAVVGTGTAYEGKVGLTLADFKDGASNTAYIVDAGPEQAVPWTKPVDLPFDSEDPIRAIGSSEFGDVFLALMADASVRAIPRDVAPESLRALFTRGASDRYDASAKRTTPLPPAVDPYLQAAAAFADKLAKYGKEYGAKSASVGEFVGAPAGFREALERELKARGLEVVPPTGERPREQLRVFGSLDDIRNAGNHTPVQIRYEWKGGAGGGKGSFDVVGARPRAPGMPPTVAPPPRPRP
jgi:hypothetical protein